MDYGRIGDYHVHTRYSDGEGEVAACVERALVLGLGEIGISDHLVPPGLGESDSYGIPAASLDRYVAEVRELATRYPQIRVLLGVEADYLPDRVQWLVDVLSAHRFDYVIGGVHFVDGFAFDLPSSCECVGWDDVQAVYRAYYETVAAAARCGLFDIVSHLDYITVWHERPAAGVEAFEAAALEAIAAAGTAIELCTTGILDPAGVMYPSARLLARACTLGVPLVIDSDAHQPDEVGFAFDSAVAAARLAGYQTTLRLSDRSFVRLP